MSRVSRAFNAFGGRIMFRAGRAGFLTSTGRRSGLPRTTPVGLVPRPDGRYLIGAGGTGRAWAANLVADPRCRLRTGAGEAAYRATLLEGDARAAALVEIRQAMSRIVGARTGWDQLFELASETAAG